MQVFRSVLSIQLQQIDRVVFCYEVLKNINLLLLCGMNHRAYLILQHFRLDNSPPAVLVS